jgi:hypothetical protein
MWKLFTYNSDEYILTFLIFPSTFARCIIVCNMLLISEVWKLQSHAHGAATIFFYYMHFGNCRHEFLFTRLLDWPRFFVRCHFVMMILLVLSLLQNILGLSCNTFYHKTFVKMHTDIFVFISFKCFTKEYIEDI